MSEPRPGSEGDTSKPLNLYKFVPGETPHPSQTGHNEGPTLMIRRIAAETVENQVAPEQKETDEYGLPVKEMLGVVGYCYSRGALCSKDIAQLLRDEPALRKKFGRKLPDEQTIRKFRRRFANELKTTLREVYKSAPSLAPAPVPTDHEKTQFLQDQAAGLIQDAAHADNTKGRVG